MDDANSTLCPPLIGQFGPAALSYRIAAAAALVVSSEVVVHYRHFTNNLSSDKTECFDFHPFTE